MNYFQTYYTHSRKYFLYDNILKIIMVFFSGISDIL